MHSVHLVSHWLNHRRNGCIDTCMQGYELVHMTWCIYLYIYCESVCGIIFSPSRASACRSACSFKVIHNMYIPSASEKYLIGSPGE